MKNLERFEEFKKQNSSADSVDADFSVSEDEISDINASITNLADKYRNEKHRLKKFGAILDSSASTPTLSEHVSDSYVEQSEDIMQSKVWVKHNVDPWEEVISKWKFTSSFRLPMLKYYVQSLDLAFIE
ncbi:hypothetical protein Avbf_00089 [Armadillidium vulgare]|nr:hypothetical protein Avbf_00089 [Armadillidium vulgare]